MSSYQGSLPWLALFGPALLLSCGESELDRVEAAVSFLEAERLPEEALRLMGESSELLSKERRNALERMGLELQDSRASYVFSEPFVRHHGLQLQVGSHPSQVNLASGLSKVSPLTTRELVGFLEDGPRLELVNRPYLPRGLLLPVPRPAGDFLVQLGFRIVEFDFGGSIRLRLGPSSNSPGTAWLSISFGLGGSTRGAYHLAANVAAMGIQNQEELTSISIPLGEKSWLSHRPYEAWIDVQRGRMTFALTDRLTNERIFAGSLTHPGLARLIETEEHWALQWDVPVESSNDFRFVLDYMRIQPTDSRELVPAEGTSQEASTGASDSLPESPIKALERAFPAPSQDDLDAFVAALRSTLNTRPEQVLVGDFGMAPELWRALPSLLRILHVRLASQLLDPRLRGKAKETLWNLEAAMQAVKELHGDLQVVLHKVPREYQPEPALLALEQLGQMLVDLRKLHDLLR